MWGRKKGNYRKISFERLAIDKEKNWLRVSALDNEFAEMIGCFDIGDPPLLFVNWLTGADRLFRHSGQGKTSFLTYLLDQYFFKLST